MTPCALTWWLLLRTRLVLQVSKICQCIERFSPDPRWKIDTYIKVAEAPWNRLGVEGMVLVPCYKCNYGRVQPRRFRGHVAGALQRHAGSSARTSAERVQSRLAQRG